MPSNIDVMMAEMRKFADRKPVHAVAGAGVLASRTLKELPWRLVQWTRDNPPNSLPGRATGAVQTAQSRASGAVQTRAVPRDRGRADRAGQGLRRLRHAGRPRQEGPGRAVGRQRGQEHHGRAEQARVERQGQGQGADPFYDRPLTLVPLTGAGPGWAERPARPARPGPSVPSARSLRARRPGAAPPPGLSVGPVSRGRPGRAAPRVPADPLAPPRRAAPAPNVPLGPGHRPKKDNLKPCS